MVLWIFKKFNELNEILISNLYSKNYNIIISYNSLNFYYEVGNSFDSGTRIMEKNWLLLDSVLPPGAGAGRYTQVGDLAVGLVEKK